MTGALSGVKQTTLLWLGGAVGFSYFGFNFMVISLLFFIFLCIIDTLYGYSLARARLIVSSKSWDVGVSRKATQVMMILGIMVLVGALSHEVQSSRLTIGLSGIVFAMIAGFSFGQVNSIIENMGVSAQGKELWFINLLLKLAGIGQAKIDEKVMKYTTPSTPTV